MCLVHYMRDDCWEVAGEDGIFFHAVVAHDEDTRNTLHSVHAYFDAGMPCNPLIQFVAVCLFLNENNFRFNVFVFKLLSFNFNF